MALVIGLLLLASALAAAAMAAWGWYLRNPQMFSAGAFWLTLLSCGFLAKLLEPSARRLDARMSID